MSDRCARCATEKGQTYDWPDNPAYCSRHVLEIVNADRMHCNYDGCPYPTNSRYNHDHPADAYDEWAEQR